MVESQAACLSEEVMLGAVVFGHQQMQVAIDNIRALAHEAGKPRWEWQAPAWETALEEAGAVRAPRRHFPSAYRITEKQQRYGRIADIKKETTAALSAGEVPQEAATPSRRSCSSSKVASSGSAFWRAIRN